MPFPLEPDAVSHGIQLAVAPVFLLTAVSGMIAAVAGRLARIIDRARNVETRIKQGAHPAEDADGYTELAELRTRGLLANSSIALLTACAFLIGLTIVGFGTFAVTKRAARSGRNPRTGAAIKIKAAKVPKFRPGKALKDALN